MLNHLASQTAKVFEFHYLLHEVLLFSSAPIPFLIGQFYFGVKLTRLEPCHLKISP
jgi:hypothetical protein